MVDLHNQEMKELQEKQKQIEEMARVMCYYNAKNFDSCTVCRKGLWSCGMLENAERLYNAGYRKIPEDAVVLTRERHEELEKAVDSVQVAVSSFTRLETLYKIKCKELELAEEKARKETAEKFKERLKEKGWRDGYDSEGVMHPYIIIDIEELDEICKELTGGKE